MIEQRCGLIELLENVIQPSCCLVDIVVVLPACSIESFDGTETEICSLTSHRLCFRNA